MMAIKIAKCDDPYCQGITLEIEDLDKLADAVAHVLAQQYSAAKRIVEGLPAGVGALPINANAIISERLRTTDNSGAQSQAVKYHRDGFLFQIIAWLASHRDADAGDVIQRPHVQHAAKGFDSSIVHFQSGTDLAALSVCEDKATEEPRKTVVDIWEEIRACERGEKDDLFRTTLIDALVRRGKPEDVAEGTAGAILWGGNRRYRIRTTVGATHKAPPKRGRLFKDFEVTAPGVIERRRGETLFLDDVRKWMEDFAPRVEKALRALEK